MNVLSLFDGMSCGQIALNRCGIKYDNYFASEIDKWAIKVTQANYPGTIQLGSVVDIKGSGLPPIDLLIGGSPCQGFSFAGKGLNFEDPRSKLFFEYVRLLNEVKPQYFLLENVKMAKEHEQVITRLLKVRPLRFNSKWVSAQTRARLYWTNIPVTSLPDLKQIPLSSILEENVKQFRSEKGQQYAKTAIYKKDRPNSIKKRVGALQSQRVECIELPEGIRFLTPLEYERLQTVPDNYTEIAPNNQRYSMLGNGWTVDIICHIFNHITP